MKLTQMKMEYWQAMVKLKQYNWNHRKRGKRWRNRKNTGIKVKKCVKFDKIPLPTDLRITMNTKQRKKDN